SVRYRIARPTPCRTRCPLFLTREFQNCDYAPLTESHDNGAMLITVKETRDSVQDVWGERTPYVGQWPVRQDVRLLEEPERWVQSSCVLCSTGCALDIAV